MCWPLIGPPAARHGAGRHQAAAMIVATCQMILAACRQTADAACPPSDYRRGAPVSLAAT